MESSWIIAAVSGISGAAVASAAVIPVVSRALAARRREARLDRAAQANELRTARDQLDKNALAIEDLQKENRICNEATEELRRRVRQLETDSAMARFRLTPGLGLAKVLDASSDAFMLARRDHKIMYVSSAWETLLGYPASEMIGKPWTQFLAPEDLVRTMAESTGLLGRDAVQFRNTYVSCTGERVPLIWWATQYEGTSTFCMAKLDEDSREDS